MCTYVIFFTGILFCILHNPNTKGITTISKSENPKLQHERKEINNGKYSIKSTLQYQAQVEIPLLIEITTFDLQIKVC